MDRASGPAAAIRRAGLLALITGLLGTAGLSLDGCTSSSSSPGPGSSAGTARASASPGLSVPGTHQATSRYQISAQVSTVVIVSHVGTVTVDGGSGTAVSVTQHVYYSKTPPATTRTVSGTTLTVTYHCPVPGTVSYKVTADARVGKTTISAPQSASSGHAITATTDVGAIIVAPSP